MNHLVQTSRIVRGLSNADYHSRKKSYSSSFLKKMANPAKAIYELENPPERTDNLSLGSAIHKWILERDKFRDEFLIGINTKRQSNADRQSWSQWYTEHGANGEQVIDRPAAQWNAEFERQTGKNMVTPETIEMLVAMADSVAANDNARALLEKGEAETSLFWQDDETGLDFQIRPDFLHPEFISDLKSAAEIDDRSITRAIANFGYSLSQAMYQDGVYQVTGDWRPFLFIFVEKSPPYLCRVIALNQEAERAGFERYRHAAWTLKQCIETDTWPSAYADNLDFSLPEWAL